MRIVIKLKYCAILMLAAYLSSSLPFNTAVFGNEATSKEVKPELSQKDSDSKKDSCCEKNIIETNQDGNVTGFQPLPEITDISMVNQNGETVRFASDILPGKITAINFIYTSCTSICQILTNNFRQLEKALDRIDKDRNVQLVSISIDPEVDTPPRLHQYAMTQKIDLSRWTLLVSGLNSIERLSRALGFSNVDKRTHAPGVVIWDDINKQCKRFAGITPSHILIKEIAKLSGISGHAAAATN